MDRHHQFGNVRAGKLRSGGVHHGIVPRDLICFRSLAFTIQFENAMLDAPGFIGCNTDKINERA